MAKLLYELEITKTPKLTEAQRGDLVATIIGGTTKKTKKCIQGAKEGLLFVDEVRTGYEIFGCAWQEDFMQ